MDVSDSDRCLRRTQTIPIPAVTFTLTQTIADVLGHSQQPPFIRSGIYVSLFVLGKQGRRAGRPQQVYRA